MKNQTNLQLLEMDTGRQTNKQTNEQTNLLPGAGAELFLTRHSPVPSYCVGEVTLARAM